MRISDWSSDVCSSDLPVDQHAEEGVERQLGGGGDARDQQGDDQQPADRPQEVPEEGRRRGRRPTDLGGCEGIEEALEEGVHAGDGISLSLGGSGSLKAYLGRRLAKAICGTASAAPESLQEG